MFNDRILDALEHQTGLIRGQLVKGRHRDILGALLSRAGVSDSQIRLLPPEFPEIPYSHGWGSTYAITVQHRNTLMQDYDLDLDDIRDFKKFNDSLDKFTPEGRLEVMKFVIAEGW